jgi:IS605 OrfB family transposase
VHQERKTAANNALTWQRSDGLGWPIDKETSKFETEKPDEKPKQLWCGDGKGKSAWLGFAFRRDKKATTSEGAVYYEKDFDILSVDLGNRFAAAVTRLRIHTEPDADGRVISADGFFPVIKAQCVRQEKLCLQGEGADVWRLVSEKNREHIAKKLRSKGIKRDPVVGQYELVEEAYGNGARGRFPTDAEYNVFKALAERLVVVTSLSLAGTDKQTYPELGNHLVFRLKRRIGRLRTLLNLVWRLRGENERNSNTGKHDKLRVDADWLFHKRMTVETLSRSKFPKRPRQEGEAEEPGDVCLRTALASDDQWQKLKNDGLLDSVKGAAENRRRQDLENTLKQPGVWNWDKLTDAVKEQIEDYFNGGDSLDRLLIGVIEFCLPLRGRHWGWDRCRNARLHWDNMDKLHNPNIQGMRGLSIKRLEQILNLRQRCQSFAKLENRYHQQFKLGNYNPPDSIARELVEDVCPLLLERSNRIREQRVDQTAHLILTEALGMELKNPANVTDKKDRKMAVDLHGEYKRRTFKDKEGKEQNYPRCSVVVLENLERYKTSQERTKTENSRLMQWAHRAIIEKLEDMCRPFGITLMLVDPAFSSHFDARTGLPGVRVNQVSSGFESGYPYNRWIEGKTKAGGETQLAKDIKLLAKTFAQHPEYKGELVLAVEGGKEFVPVLSLHGKEGLINADVCAAGNIGHRGVADPQRWDIFPRLRTKQISETVVSVTNWRGWFGTFLKDSEPRQMRAVEVETSEQAVAPEKKKGKKSASASRSEGETSDSDDSQSGQSSEYPPFFVANPQHDWLPDGDWLKQKAFKFEQNGKTVSACRQGEYLKRVEQVCSERIKAINNGRIGKLSKA